MEYSGIKVRSFRGGRTSKRKQVAVIARRAAKDGGSQQTSRGTRNWNPRRRQVRVVLLVLFRQKNEEDRKNQRRYLYPGSQEDQSGRKLPGRNGIRNPGGTTRSIETEQYVRVRSQRPMHARIIVVVAQGDRGAAPNGKLAAMSRLTILPKIDLGVRHKRKVNRLVVLGRLSTKRQQQSP